MVHGDPVLTLTVPTTAASHMREANDRGVILAEMLTYVPSALPGAVSLIRNSNAPWRGYTLRYLKTRSAPADGDKTPEVEMVELPIAAAWSGHFIAGIVLAIVGMGLAVLLPAATHDRAFALIAVAFLVAGLTEFWRSSFTPVEPDRLSVANAVMRLRLEAIAVAPSTNVSKRLAEERNIGDLLLRLAMSTPTAGIRSWGRRVAQQ